MCILPKNISYNLHPPVRKISPKDANKSAISREKVAPPEVVRPFELLNAI